MTLNFEKYNPMWPRCVTECINIEGKQLLIGIWHDWVLNEIIFNDNYVWSYVKDPQKNITIRQVFNHFGYNIVKVESYNADDWNDDRGAQILLDIPIYEAPENIIVINNK